MADRLIDETVDGYGNPLEKGTGRIVMQKINGREAAVQVGMYDGITEFPDGMKYRIEFPTTVKLEKAIYCNDRDLGVREARRYIAEKLKIGCAPKAVPV